MLEKNKNGVIWQSSPLLGKVPHGFSTRVGGVSPAPWDSLNLGPHRGDDPERVLKNYQRFCACIGINYCRTVLSQQVHGDYVRICTEADAGKGLFRERDYEADALLSNTPGLALVVFSADCGTILLYDPVHQAVGAAHAGWRGCAKGIPAKLVRAMTETYGSRPEDLRAASGSCICQNCFETDADVPDAMRNALGKDAEKYIKSGINSRYSQKKFQVDLSGLNREWLLRAGIPEKQIDVSELCTACRQDLFWSARKVGNQRGSQAAVIALPDCSA